jgi:hypothetical protein
MPAGAIIGKGGQNIKLLQQRSGEMYMAPARLKKRHTCTNTNFFINPVMYCRR